MKLSLLIGGLVLLLVVIGASRAFVAPQPQGGVDQETVDIARQLKCPVCQSESVADSPAPLAGQIRDIIHQKLAAGESREEILAYFTSIYGEDVLLDPPKAGFSSLVWIGGLAVPLAGLALAWWTWRGSRKGRARESDLDQAAGSELGDLVDDESMPLVEAELERIVGGGAR